ncbi:hypothetical protein MGG_09094 [Pyricularia oryzae 70-15]|uniref:Uncharacterized protein n=1 Tax=Pyricularia oryzae (strain 70-15 / ATCC MYA-4617 / FGSC 8958) TaxID=242507 RepID=G4MZU9_PYRO7|nr:uncharacterized protein MGG_09094 [Pyricularia oryzae 70-15]EHA51393.1 hypothetical protein MGG_09094 [Pyricularia oryzae 70-15]
MRTVGTFAYIVLANACPRTIVRDVVVIGGGAPRRIRTGCVLRVDLNKDGGFGGEGRNLGGEDICRDPPTPMPSLPATAISITTEYADSTSSQGVLFVPPSSNASSNATRKYKGSGREDTPDDLLMPFRGFGDKYQIQDVVPTIWRITGSAFCVPMTGAMLMEQEQMVVAWDRNPDLLELDEQKRDSISKLNCNANWAGIESSHLLGNGTLYSIRASAAAANYLELPK